jgi:hypothetical protein
VASVPSGCPVRSHTLKIDAGGYRTHSWIDVRLYPNVTELFASDVPRAGNVIPIATLFFSAAMLIDVVRNFLFLFDFCRFHSV